MDTALEPRALLEQCRRIEREMGRRPSRRWGEREIDIDLLLFADHQIQKPELTIPHPSICERDFVLAPLRDLRAPAPPSLAPEGWERALEAIPPALRCILRAEEWK